MTFLDQGRFEEANALSLRAIKILERLGPDDPNFVNSLHNRSELLIAQARVGICIFIISYNGGARELFPSLLFSRNFHSILVDSILNLLLINIFADMEVGDFGGISTCRAVAHTFSVLNLKSINYLEGT